VVGVRFDSPDPQYRRVPDEIAVGDNDWLTLGQLRALVHLADQRSWPDKALISHSQGGDHPRRHDVRTARRIVIEGNDPEDNR